MSLSELIKPYFWQSYSKKLKKKLSSPKFIGSFTAAEAEEKNMRLVTAIEGALDEGAFVSFYLLVDESDGVISDAKFQAFGPSALIGASEAFCELMIRKNYDQVSRITADLIDQSLQDRSSESAFSSDCMIFLNQVITTIDQIVHQCCDMPFKSDYKETPIAFDLETSVVENFEALLDDKKRAIIEEIIDKEIRPFVELDAGGVSIKELQGLNVFISYIGNCTSCPAATGSTLNAIEQILRAKVHPMITVTAVL